MLLPVLTVVIFAVTLGLTFSFAYLFIQAPLEHRKMMTRLAAVQEIAVRNDAMPDVLRKELMSDVPILNRVLELAPGVPQLRLFLEQGAIRLQVGTFILISFATFIFLFVATLIIGLPLFQCFPAALLGSVIPFIGISAIRRRRFDKFEEQFPEAMDLLGRAVRAGHAFTTGFELIGKEMPDPVGEEFQIAFQQQNLGLPLRDALENMTVRIPLPDVRIFVSSLQIQRESGGNLGEILDTMSNVVRERFKLRRQVRTYTAEARLSSYVLSSLPFAALAALYVLKPDYIMPLFTDPQGHRMLGFAAILQVVGYVVINKIIKIKV
jgi:tight adherence protein B